MPCQCPAGRCNLVVPFDLDGDQTCVYCERVDCPHLCACACDGTCQVEQAPSPREPADEKDPEPPPPGGRGVTKAAQRAKYNEARHRGKASSGSPPAGFVRAKKPRRRLGEEDGWGEGPAKRWASPGDTSPSAKSRRAGGAGQSVLKMGMLLTLASLQPTGAWAPHMSTFTRQEVIENVSFVPLWAPRPAPGPPMGGPAGDAKEAHGPVGRHARTGPEAVGTFTPLWAKADAEGMARPDGDPDERTHATRDALRSAHPYAEPAYGASALRSDQIQTAKELAQRLARDRSAGRIGAPLAQLEDMALAVAEARADGVNPRTASKDDFAKREFEAFAKVMNFDPNLRTNWTRAFPERESLKLASFLLWRAQRAVPRSRKDTAAKPMSIYQNYLALRRVFRARDVELPPPGVVRETLRGLIRRFIRRFGIDALRPKRVEPVTPTIVRDAINLAREGRTFVGGMLWKLTTWTVFVVTAWMVTNLSIGSRKGESTKLPGDVDENDWFNRASLTWVIDGRTVTEPTEPQLESVKEGDSARLAPRGSKCDQWGSRD